MSHRIVFTGKQQVAFEPVEIPAPAVGQVRVRTICSLMSTGTENIVFNRMFEPGTQWDQWVKYPFAPGYASVGVVEAVGPGVKRRQVGERVCSRSAHVSHVVEAEEKTYGVPAGMAPEQAVWFALAKITAMGARAAEYAMGDSVLIIGAGPIGQMSVRWAHAMGVETIIVADLLPQRLELAKRGGATAVIGSSIEDALPQVLASNHGEKTRVVIDSTGSAAVFGCALGLTARLGRMVLLGDTGSPSKQTLTSDLITQGISVVGAYDTLERDGWTMSRITRLFFNLVQTGRMDVTQMNTHCFRPECCAEAYALANTRRGETMGIVFDWSR